MKLDSRDLTRPPGLPFVSSVDPEICYDMAVIDKETGKIMNDVVAVDDSTGQVIRYGRDANGKLNTDALVSEIINVELVYMRVSRGLI